MLQRSFLLLLLLHCCVAEAQFAAAYEDTRGYFYVFENGAPHQAETQRVLRYKVAGNTVLYIDNANEMKLWYNGQRTKEGEGLSAILGGSGNLLYYMRDNALTVIDEGKFIPLTYFLGEFKANDNIIAFKDSRYDVLRVYYKGTVQELEYTLVSELGKFEVGDNTVAYTNGSHYFKVFSEGETFELSNWEPDQFICGRNMVAYVDGNSKQLKLFTKDKIITLEEFAPISMQMGDDIFAYVSDENAFKVYTNGKLLKIESYLPDYYLVKDNIVAFYTEYMFQVLHNGVRHELERFRPRNFIISNNCIAYVDNAGRLKMFCDGKTVTVTTETIEEYELNGDVLKYNVSGGVTKVYYKGKTYE